MQQFFMSNPIKPTIKSEFFPWPFGDFHRRLILFLRAFSGTGHHPLGFCRPAERLERPRLCRLLFPGASHWNISFIFCSAAAWSEKRTLRRVRSRLYYFPEFYCLFYGHNLFYRLACQFWLKIWCRHLGFGRGWLAVYNYGNYMGKLKPNWFVGIRTPWTLSSETFGIKRIVSAAKFLCSAAWSWLLPLLRRCPGACLYSSRIL